MALNLARNFINRVRYSSFTRLFNFTYPSGEGGGVFFFLGGSRSSSELVNTRNSESSNLQQIFLYALTFISELCEQGRSFNCRYSAVILMMLVLSILLLIVVSIDSLKIYSFKPKFNDFKSNLSRFITTAVITTTLGNTFMIPNFVQPVLADARLNAPTAAGTRVNSDPESLLRYGLPIANDKELREIQENIEAAKVDLKTRRIIFAKNDISNAKSLLTKYTDKILKAAPANHKDQVKASIERMNNDFPIYEKAVGAESNAGSGSLQERKGLDDSFAAQTVLSQELTTLEELMVPDNYKRLIPPEFNSMPQLQGRAEVEVTFKKPDGSQFNVEGKLYDQIGTTSLL